MSGIFGIASKSDCAETLFYGTDYHSHLGTQYGGLAVAGENGLTRKIHNISQGQFKSRFYGDYAGMKGGLGIGVISGKEEQPIYLNSQFGPFCIVTNGLIENADALAKETLEHGGSFSEMTNGTVNTTELVAKLISKGDSILDGIQKVFDKIDGSISLLILMEDGIYAARDRFGNSPLVIGQRGEDWAVTSETCAFHNLGFKTQKYLGPGEIVFINENDGVRQEHESGNQTRICAFLWVYTGYPASDYEDGLNVECARERCGKCLAMRDDVEVDVVAGVPDSGIAHAIGYAMESKVPFRRPLVKYTDGYGRSYTPPSQEIRDRIALLKLIPVREVISGNRLIICEDSIVRGTQLKNFTIQKLWDNGAKEIHVRPACPPLMWPCRFNLSTRSIHELVARRAIRAIEGEDIEDVSEYVKYDSPKYKRMVDWIAKDLGVTTLKYQALEDMVEAIGLPADRLCLYCWAGEGS
ncbi:MAG: amidophosphoribosyltransferase [Planctomycetota bacterium]|nr:MAG: amidophosphoribosyltransferase [Planctomycetota bacterium]